MSGISSRSFLLNQGAITPFVICHTKMMAPTLNAMALLRRDVCILWSGWWYWLNCGRRLLDAMVRRAVQVVVARWALPALSKFLFLLTLSLYHPISKLVEKLTTGFLLLDNLVNIFVHSHHSLHIAGHLLRLWIWAVLEDRLLVTSIAEPNSFIDVMLAGNDLTVGDQLVIIINDQDGVLLRKLHWFVWLGEYWRHFSHATSYHRMSRLMPLLVQFLIKVHWCCTWDWWLRWCIVIDLMSNCFAVPLVLA